MNSKCLNCGSETINSFCSVCGQKNSTHRFSLKHFVLHDFIHGVFHLDKGLLFTIKALFTKPGHSTREYIQGKRVNYFNYFALLFIIIAITHFTAAFTKDIDSGSGSVDLEGYSKVAEGYAKYVILSFVPFFAFASYLLFKKSKQNYMEHLVMTIYMICGILIINYISTITSLFCSDFKVIKYVHSCTELLKIAYFFWFYYQYFSGFNYKKGELIVRCIAIIVIVVLISLTINRIINHIGLLYFH
ncbi:DUF3667 domain-containing protein [Elizabethkingia meningoseptica]|uniref:DUF3667 domain-containing protein n=1 Tax=Elizabethkingia meningoseptica TaxID=238 RepID=UPI0038912FA9